MYISIPEDITIQSRYQKVDILGENVKGSVKTMDLKKTRISNIAIRGMYTCLNKYFGDLKWWPAKSRFEVIVGAILTQNTSWKNVEKAVKELRSRKLLGLSRLLKADDAVIQSAIKCTGYYKQKTQTLKNICAFLYSECGHDLKKSLCLDTKLFRAKLLAVKGIGNETADSILLYAFNRPVFVVDAYSVRIFTRHNLVKENAKYRDVQHMVHNALGCNVSKFNQFHALLVEVGKQFCHKSVPKCAECPMKNASYKKKISLL